MTGSPADTITDTEPTTAYDWLRHHARRRPDAPAVTTWRDGAVRGRLSFQELSGLVDRSAAAMPAFGTSAGDRVVLALPNDDSFTTALLAAIGAGLIAVPAPTPGIARGQAFRDRLKGIVENCRPVLVITLSRWVDGLRAMLDQPDALWRVRSWESLLDLGKGVALEESGGRTGCDIAFLQYTSGSTGSPKGVAISHRALRASCGQAARAYGEQPGDTAVTWVPLYHDMGLVTGVFRPLFTGYESVLLSPQEFVRAPGSWLSAIGATRGTLSSAPDFAYEHCVRKISVSTVPSFDLSSWRIARNAGEVIRADTADRFTARFAAADLRADSLCPSYGMAEATLGVTTCTPNAPPARLTVRRNDLQTGAVVPVGDHTDNREPTVELLSSGTPLPGTGVEIRDGEDRADRPDGVIGDVFIQGAQLFSGYWPENGDDADGQPEWHATGDRGFLHHGHLFVVGRGDDTLVHHGRKFHSADILAACAGVPGLRPGRCAAFTSETPAIRVRLVAELKYGNTGLKTEIALQIRRRLAERLDLYVSDVAFLAAGQLPVTTSGKVRVAETRRRFEQGLLPLL